MDNEECWVLLGNIAGPVWYGAYRFLSEGQPCQVSFDPDWIIAKEEKDKSVIGFLHTHPSFPASTSDRDHKTMGAWALCLGKPLVCSILGVDGLKSYWYTDDESPPIVEKKTRFMHPYVVGILPKKVKNHGKLEVSARGTLPWQAPGC